MSVFIHRAEYQVDDLVTQAAADPHAIFNEVHRRLAQQVLDRAMVDLVRKRAIVNYRVLKTVGAFPFTTLLRHEMEMRSADKLLEILNQVIALLELRLQLVSESSEGHRVLNEQIQRLELIAKFLK